MKKKDSAFPISVFISVSVSEGMVGHKFGEFAPTRTFHGHGGDKKVTKTA